MSRARPRVGVRGDGQPYRSLTAAYPACTWQWYQESAIRRWAQALLNLPTVTTVADDASDVCVIAGARSDTHTPTEGDEAKSLTGGGDATLTDIWAP